MTWGGHPADWEFDPKHIARMTEKKLAKKRLLATITGCMWCLVGIFMYVINKDTVHACFASAIGLIWFRLGEKPYIYDPNKE